MALTNALHKTVEELFAWLGSSFKQTVNSYCDLESADSQYALIGKGGELASIISIDGFHRFVSTDEFNFISQRISDALQPVFATEGHSVQVFFSYNPDLIEQEIDNSLKGAKLSAKRIGLQLDDIFESRKDAMKRYCATEKCYLVIWTSTKALSRVAYNQSFKAHSKNLIKAKLPKAQKAQRMLTVLPEVRNIHQSLVDSLVEDLNYTGLYVRLLEVHEAVREVRASVDPNYTDERWEPSLPGDKLPINLSKKQNGDISSFLWTPLDEQIFPREAENIDMKTTKVGDMLYSSMFIDLFPKDVKPFYDLFRRLKESGTPWRISYSINPKGVSISKSKALLAQFLTITSVQNKLIVNANQLLRAIDESSDDPVIKLSVCFSTWAHEGKEPLLRERTSRLYKIIQGWGGADVSDMFGDPFSGALSSALGVMKQAIAPATAAPLSDVVRMLPTVRPASPWQDGALLFRSPDGKLWPYQPGSSQQISWIDLIYARSGSGKSVLLNSINLGVCLSKGLESLPYVALIDIGPSSKGFISLLQQAMPEDQRHLMMYHRLKMTKEDAVNPFDTLLGARYPTSAHRIFLVNFISALVLDNVDDSLPEGMASMISMIIDETYKQYSDDQQAKRYNVGINDEIDTIIQEIAPDEVLVSWWDVVDKLFEHKAYRLAQVAQCYAMPNIADTVSIAHHYAIKDLYGDVTMSTGEDYITAYCRLISSVIRNFPSLVEVTKLFVSSSKIISIDLNDVAHGGSEVANKQTSIAYMLARHVIAQHFFTGVSELKSFPEKYRPYHAERFREMANYPKRLVFDEFHRTAKSTAVREQVLRDMREGRKWKVQISLASQSLQDFDPLMLEFATSVFILDSGPQKAIDETCETFGLSNTERLALTTRVHGPTSRGATFIAQFATKKGSNTQLLTSTLGAVELWALNTTLEDAYIRDELYEKIDPVKARKLLANRFPSGTATEYLEVVGRDSPEKNTRSLCNEIIDELVTEYFRKQQFDLRARLM
ncbi:AAA family ATPase [Thiotrichales bacterium 19S9-12]|nr:AAA family ATPase [Thiotrichales bacterium 19S9-11]MCF6812152.1 AAA family ATPase [Thiotrichales bacterium 19S9-12]